MRVAADDRHVWLLPILASWNYLDVIKLCYDYVYEIVIKLCYVYVYEIMIKLCYLVLVS